MPKAKVTSMATLSSQIDEIQQATVKAEAAHVQMLAQADKLAALHARLGEAIGKRSAGIEEVLTRLGNEGSLAAGVAKLRALEKTDNAAMIKLQMAMQRENQVFTTVSNVLKTRHDTIKNAISNIR